MKRLLPLPLLVIVLLVPASLALGAAFSLPKSKNSKIVLPTSIAGLSVGMQEAKARGAWGAKRGNCTKYGTAPYLHTDCDYGDFESASTGSAEIDFFNGKLTTVLVNSARVGTGNPNFKAAGVLLGMKTKEGFGIGAKYAGVKKAYPKGKLKGSPRDERFIYEIKGKGKAYFTFTFWGKNQKAFILNLNDGVYHP